MNEPSFRTTRLHACLERMRAGEAAARDELIRDCQERFLRLARKMLHGFPGVARHEQTDDVAQNAMPRLLRALEEVRPASVREFFGLAALKIRQVLMDMARHYRIELARRESVASADPADLSHEPRRLAEWCELHEKIDRLPEEEKEIMDLRFYQGLQFNEIATLLGVTERTAQRRWSAALLRLHDLLQGNFPEL
jgi:RNA polymerase sigma factor (sigma-70 family)